MLVFPALNLCTLDAGILIIVQKVRLMLFSMNKVDYSMSFLSLSTFDLQVGGTILSKFYSLGLVVGPGTPPSWLKVGGWWLEVGGGLQQGLF